MKNKLLASDSPKKEEKLKQLFRYLVGFAALVLIFMDGGRFIKSLSFGETLKLVRTFSLPMLLQFMLVGLFAVWLTSFYDYVVLRRMNITIPYLRIVRVSWIANTFNNIAGFGGLGGIGARLLLYKDEVMTEKVIQRMGFLIIPATITGLGCLMVFNLTGLTHIQPLIHTYRWLPILMVGFMLYVPVFCWFTEIKFSKFSVSLSHGKDHEETITRLILTLISAFDWAAAAFVLWVIAVSINPSITYLEAVGLFSLATAAGISSMIPGGLGTFDLMLLTGLGVFGVPPQEALAILMLFRFFYYLLPLILGAFMAFGEMLRGVHYISRKLQHFLHLPELEAADTSSPKMIFGEIASKGLYVLILLGGLLMVISASTPGLPDRISFMSNLLSIPLLQFSHRISLIIGLLVLMLAEDIRLGIHRAWLASMLLMALGGISTFVKGFDYEELIYLLTVFTLLAVSKPVFNRVSAPVNIRRLIGTYLLTGFFALLYVLSGQPHPLAFLKTHSGISMLQFTSDDFTFNGLLAVIISWTMYTVWTHTNQKPILDKFPLDHSDYRKLDAFLDQHTGTSHTHLLYLGDKRLYWYQEDQVLIAYQKSGDALVALGAPIGNELLFKEAIESFRRIAERFGLTTVFYQVPNTLLPILHDCGFAFFKLGEEAYVDLNEFSLDASSFKGFRNTRNRFEKIGYVFEMLSAAEIDAHMTTLRHISDIWLSGRTEKQFSLGFFHESYIKNAPVAVLKNEQQEIVAFASLMPGYQDMKEISVDLMRFLPNGPNGLMDYLFIQLLQWAKNEGYEHFNFGMAPLSSVGKQGYPSQAERLAGFLYTHGGHFYSFEGLYQYKRKFHPKWYPRYLAYSRGKNLSTVIIHVANLINRKKVES